MATDIIAFEEALFPPDVSYGATGGPGFLTTINEAKSGLEQRNVEWSRQRCEYDVSKALQDEDEKEMLLNWFYVMHGRGVGFRYKDWLDYTVKAGVLGIGDGFTKTYQLVKRYKIPTGSEYVRKITKPCTPNQFTDDADVPFNVYLNNVLQASNTYTLDTTTGLLTFTTAPRGNAAPAVPAFSLIDGGTLGIRSVYVSMSYRRTSGATAGESALSTRLKIDVPANKLIRLNKPARPSDTDYWCIYAANGAAATMYKQAEYWFQGGQTYWDEPSTGAVFSGTAAPAATMQAETITADFNFHVPVRFDTDKMKASIEGFDDYAWQQIVLVELKK